MRPLNTFFLLVATSFLALPSDLAAQSYFHINQITVAPSSPTDQDDVQLQLSGVLTNSGAYVASSSAQITGYTVDVTVDAMSTGGPSLQILHTETVDLGMLPAGTYTITIGGTHNSDTADPDQHSFTVTGGTSICDSLVIASVNWAPFSDTAIVVHVLSPTSTVIDSPGFLLVDANGDTLAQETGNSFGTPADNWHTLAVKPGANIPDGVFLSTLELPGSNANTACSWTMDASLCPTTACDTLFPMIQNVGTGTATGSFLYHLQQGGLEVASGTLALSSDVQFDSDTLCVAPGTYLLEIIPQQGPNGGEPHFGVAYNGGIQGPTAPVIWTTYCAEAFPFYGTCADISTGINEPSSAGLRIAQSFSGISLTRSDSKALGDIQVFDAQGRMITSTKDASGRWKLSTASWTAGLYLIRTVGTDNRLLVTRWIVE
ncbi:MAG: T9SS type A sorting domain-containing protein [Flavobacteriales bacterium]